MKKSKYFDIRELVCTDVYNRDGQEAWRYIHPVIVDFLDWIREKLDKPVYVNNWYWGGNKSQRGFRCNLCPLVKSKKTLYVSAHMLGKGVDFNVKGMTPDEVREWIHKNINNFFTFHPWYIKKCRLESSRLAPTWVHIDFFEHDKEGIIYEF